MVVEMPPLRDRPEDILLLSNLFIEENNREHAKNIKGFRMMQERLMTQYHWPGNVRELKNVIERAMILTDQEWITPDNLPFEMREGEKSTQPIKKGKARRPLEFPSKRLKRHISAGF